MRRRGQDQIRLAMVFSALLCCAGLGLLGGASPAHASSCAAQDNYTGAANGSWEVKANWSKGSLPSTTETACIPEGKGTITIGAGIKAEVKTLLAQSAVHVAATGSLTISETFVPSNPTKNEETASRFTDGLTIDASGAVSTAGNWILMFGTVLLEGEIKNTPLNTNQVTARLESGTLEGEGTTNILFQNIGGTVQPGGANHVGTLHVPVQGDQSSTGTLVLDIASKTSFDRIASGSSFTWLGTLDVNLLGGFEPAAGTNFEFQTGGGSIGDFESVTPGFSELHEPNADAVHVLPRKPTTVTDPPTEVTQTTAVINGTVNPNTLQVLTCAFEFGTSTSYSGGVPCPTPPGHGAAVVAESVEASNLTPGTTYHYRIIANNSEAGLSQGEDVSFTTLPASSGETPSGGTATSGGGTAKTGGEAKPELTPVTTPQAAEELRLGCTKSQLVLNDAYIHGNRVILLGSAAKSLAGKKVTILFNEKKAVATATVQPGGEFATTAVLPPARIRDALTTRYSAEIGTVRSLHLKLVRRLLLEPPKASGDTITLAGRVTKPLTKPIAPIVVEQQLECGKTTIAKQFTPPASGVFHLTLTVPSGTTAAIYTLKSKVAANAHALAKGFKTYSLPLPVAID